jgi:predicted dehydrogenase
LINRILIVGYGSIGRRHLRIARELMPLADIRILRHQTRGEIPELANGCFYAVENAIQFHPQIAVIASPAPFHIDTAIILAESGVHLLIEKPLATSLNGVEELMEVCKKKNIFLSTGYNLRYLPSLQHFRELLDKGLIGRILSVRCEVGQYLPSWRPDFDYRQGVSAKRELGGGALLELSHELDYLRWIFGRVDWISATLSRQSSLEIDVEDTAHLTLGFGPKLDGQQVIGVVSLDFIRHDTTRLCTAIGEKASLRWDGVNGKVLLYEAGSNKWVEIFEQAVQRDDSYIAEWRNFIDSAANHKPPFVSGEDGLEVLRIIEAAKHSAESSSSIYELKNLRLLESSS